LARAFLDLEFSYFPVVKKNNVLVASMVRYIENLDYLVAFEKDKIKTSLSKILAENNLKQLKIAEKVKSYHLTFYFNGFISEPHPNEFWKILPSQDVSIKENPLMRSYEITNLVINALKEKIYDFIAVNYAAPDIIAHTGDINLAKLVVEEIDKLLKKIYNVLDENWVLIITSDHGNIEEMVRIDTREISTSHDFNPVPCYIVNKDFYIENKSNDLKAKEKKIIGSLIDIAPTILELMELNVPKEMEGKNLLKYYF
jgi:2,3-bisphosphoglycerate-independent phosphoglycerate mutase